MEKQEETKVTLQPIEVQAPNVLYKAGTIDFSMDELDESIAEIEKRYAKLIVSEDQKSDIKDIRAQLKKASDELDDKRKEVQKDWNEPLEKYLGEIKKYKDRIKVVRDNLDGQLKEIDNGLKLDKKEKLRKAFEEMDDVLELGFDYFFEEWMMNLSTSHKKAKEAILAKLTKISNEYTIVQNMNVRYPQMLLEIFKEKLDLTSAMDAYNEQEKLVMEYEKPKEEPKESKATYITDTKEIVKALDDEFGFLNNIESEPKTSDFDFLPQTRENSHFNTNELVVRITSNNQYAIDTLFDALVRMAENNDAKVEVVK